MRRPLLNTSSPTNTRLTTNVEQRTTVEYAGVELERRLRQKRSLNYVESMAKLDAGGVKCSDAEVNELIEQIKSEFPDLEPYQFPLGIIAKCYLGGDFIVHTLDTKLDIIEHYKKGETLPPQMERGKSIALHPSYEFIEIYTDTLRAVDSNGNVSVIKG